MSVSPRFVKLLEEMLAMHENKNAGYAGDSSDPFKNFRNSELFGITPFKGCLVRMSDKFMRIANLSKNPNADKVGESIKDTLMDLAVYSLIAICLYEEEEFKEGKSGRSI
jgi:hypothetical protein